MPPYHLTPDGPKICRARKRPCRYGQHYDKSDEAYKAYEVEQSHNNQTIATTESSSVNEPQENNHSRIINPSHPSASWFYTQVCSERVPYEDFTRAKYCSAQEFETALEIRRDIIQHAVETYNIDPKNSPELRDALENFRDDSARLVYMYTHYNPHFHRIPEMENISRLGSAKLSGTDRDTDPEWYQRRAFSIGGSEVADFVVRKDKTKLSPAMRAKFKPISREEAIKRASYKNADGHGPLWRGSVYESYILSEHAQSIEEKGDKRTLVLAKDQYKNPQYEWAEVNVDGVFLNEQGKPEGIAEVKTGRDSWGDTVPEKHRAQALHYLEITGLQYCDILKSSADGKPVVYRILRGENVSEDKPHPITHYYEHLSSIFNERRNAIINAVENI